MNLVERVAIRYLGSLRRANTLPMWSIVSSVKRALQKWGSIDVYETLKSLSDTLSSLGRVDPPLAADVVREGHELSRKLAAAEKQLLSAMIDVQNLFVSLEHEDESRHEHPEKFASSGYGPYFHTLVDLVDALDVAQKKIPHAKAALEQIKQRIANDPDVANLPDLNKFAPAQHAEALERSLDRVETALEDLSWQYDDSNKAFLRMGLR